MGHDQSQHHISAKRVETLNREAICVAAAAAQMSDYHLLQRLGIDERNIPQLCGITIRALERIRDFPVSVVDVSFNTKALNNLLKRLEDETTQEQLIDRAIRLGLRQPMLQTLTGTSRREYDQRRALMGLPARERGRIEGLTEREELHVLELWADECQQSDRDDLERLCNVAERSGIGADRIWNAVMEGI